MDFEGWKPLALPFGLLEDEVDVLEVLGHAAFGDEVASDHLGTLDVHDLRIGGGAARHVEKGRGVEPEPLGKDQAFRQRQKER